MLIILLAAGAETEMATVSGHTLLHSIAVTIQIAVTTIFLNPGAKAYNEALVILRPLHLQQNEERCRTILTMGNA